MARSRLAKLPNQDAPRLPADDRVDLASWLPGSTPLEIEVGPGRGAFMLERCADQPELRLLGIEIRRKWATIVDARLAKAGFGDRARVVCEDARFALSRLKPNGSVSRVFIHFPDPWWKKRHQKRMVVVEPLIEQIARLLCCGGELFIQTDVPERADAYEERVSNCDALVPHGDVPGSARVAANPYGARGNRERHADADGLPVHRLRFRRR